MVDGIIGIWLTDPLVRSRVKDKTSPPPRPPPPRAAAVGRASPPPSRVDTVLRSFPRRRGESRAVSFRRSATLRRACPPFTENLHANTRRTRYQNIMGEKTASTVHVATGEHLIDLNYSIYVVICRDQPVLL